MLLAMTATDALAQGLPLPPDLVVAPPTSDVPEPVARFAGYWGDGYWNGDFPHGLVVERVDRDGNASVVYAIGAAAENPVGAAVSRMRATIHGDQLRVEQRPGAPQITYTLRSDGLLQGRYFAGRESLALLRRVDAKSFRRFAAAAHALPYRTVQIPARSRHEAEDRALNLAATVYLPSRGARWPVLVFNHGSTGPWAIPVGATQKYETQARYFLDRGYAVVAPMRRGRGGSEGAYEEESHGPSSPEIERVFSTALDDIDATVDFVLKQPWAEGDRIVMAGQSRGGILSVAYAGRHPEKVAGVINFAGGWFGTRSGDPRAQAENDAAMRQAARTARAPMLWLYAANDSYYDAASIRATHAAFEGAGGTARLMLLDHVPGNGHGLLGFPVLWLAPVDELLRQARR